MPRSRPPTLFVLYIFVCLFTAPLCAQEENYFEDEFPQNQETKSPFAKSEFAETFSIELNKHENVDPDKTIVDPQVVQTQAVEAIPIRTSQSKQQKNQAFAKKFWDYLLTNNYKHWSPPTGKPSDFHAANRNGHSNGSPNRNPHGPLQKVYVNRAAAGSSNHLPEGSIVILENYRVDKSLKTISVMYRSPGFNPAANDWFWVDYNPDGSIVSDWEHSTAARKTIDENGIQGTFVSASKPMPKKLVGRANSCIQCHGVSNDGDFAFFNDQASEIRQASATSDDAGNEVIFGR